MGAALFYPPTSKGSPGVGEMFSLLPLLLSSQGDPKHIKLPLPPSTPVPKVSQATKKEPWKSYKYIYKRMFVLSPGLANG